MKKLLSIILSLILLFSCTACGVQSPKQYEYERDLAGRSLLVHFIDVGQGDSILLESKGSFVLIDAGEKSRGSDVVDYIRSRGADKLDYIIATHPHSDHIGGMAKVIKSISADNFITVETDQNTSAWLNVLKAVDDRDINYIDAVAGSTYSFGEAQFTIMAPLSSGYSGYNDYSVVTKVTCGSISFMLTGDAEKQSEKEMIKSGEDLKADVLKCGHHGSSSSSTAAFLKAVDPSYAVISCGKDNDYGHPHKETLKKLGMLDCAVYRTDELGTIVASTDGSALSFYSADDERILSTQAGDDPSSSDSAETSAPITGSEGSYIGNKNSKVFHLPNCESVSAMSEKNKVEFNSRDDAINSGYRPCSSCDP